MLEAKTGTWTLERTGELKGVVPAALRGYCIQGEETDTEYEVFATLRIVKGTKASVIVFYTVVEAVESFVEFTLDAVNNKAKLDEVNGEIRTNIREVAYTIDTNQDYDVQVSAKNDGTVEASINGAIVCKATTAYTTGKHGFGCEGTVVEDFSYFNKRFHQQRDYYTRIDVLTGELANISYKELVGKNGTIQQYYNKLKSYIEQCSQFIDSETERDSHFFQNGGLSIIEYHDGVGSSPPSGMYEFAEEQDAWKERAATIFTRMRPIKSMTQIRRNTASIGEIDSWELTTKYRWYTHGEIVFASGAIPAAGKKNVEITYVGGYTKTPVDVQMACTRLIVNLIHKQISDRTAGFTSFARPTAINFAMPDVYTPDIKAVLKRYKLLGFGEM